MCGDPELSCPTLLAAGRTERLVNPLAWKKGLVLAQCADCKVWHKLADAANLIDEVRYADEEESASSGGGGEQ